MSDSVGIFWIQHSCYSEEKSNFENSKKKIKTDFGSWKRIEKEIT